METFLIKALQLIASLALLVMIHEFGHYIFARMFGIRVNRFYMFFNPWFSLLKYYPSEGKLELIAWTKKKKNQADPDSEPIEEPRALLTIKTGKPKAAEKNGRPTWAATMYGIGWLPLGGYCDIAGMVDETKGADQLAAEPQPWEFRSKAAWKRFLVMVAGVLFNFVLAIIIYAGIAYHWGDRAVPYDEAYEGMDYSASLEGIGFRDGDIIIDVNGEKPSPINYSLGWDLCNPGTVTRVLRNHADTVSIVTPADMLERLAALDPEQAKAEGPLLMMRVPVIVYDVQGGMSAKEAGLQKGDRILKLGNDTTPSFSDFNEAIKAYKDVDVEMLVSRDGSELTTMVHPNSDGKIGIVVTPATEIYNFKEIRYNLLQSLPRGWQIGTSTLGAYVSSMRMLFTKSGMKQVGGFGTLGGLFPEKWNWYQFWQITAFLSVILAFMNIIPIPGLDGGHVLFLLWEIITGRKVSDKVLEWANTIGFMFLLLLLLYANGADIFRAFK